MKMRKREIFCRKCQSKVDWVWKYYKNGKSIPGSATIVCEKCGILCCQKDGISKYLEKVVRK
jgi:hypothetical protein